MNFIVATRYVDRIPRKRKKRLKKAGVKLAHTHGFTFVGTLEFPDAPAGYIYNVYMAPPSLNIR